MTIVSKSTTHEWGWFSVTGSQFTLEGGTAGTLARPNGFPPATFPSQSTVILGAASTHLMHMLAKTSALWSIGVPREYIASYGCGFLMISAIRQFAGLHSKVYDSKAEVALNGSVVDYFGLRLRPEQHSDYFHRPELPKLPLPQEIRDCRTVYCWPVIREKLATRDTQEIRITIDQYVRWDIDHVGLLIKMLKPHQVFISHNWHDKPTAKTLARDLAARGVRIWIDEAEIRLGDSLITKIREGIDKVDYLVVLISRHSIQSEWVTKEVDIAMNQEIEGKQVKVIPILLDDVSLPGFLKGKLYADLRSMDNYDFVLSQLEARLQST